MATSDVVSNEHTQHRYTLATLIHTNQHMQRTHRQQRQQQQQKIHIKKIKQFKAKSVNKIEWQQTA